MIQVRAFARLSTRVGLLTLLASLSLGLLTGCDGRGTAASRQPGDPLRVVCTTGQVGDLVTQVGGEHVRVETLMGPGVDPHLFRASPGDIQAIKGANVVFYNGLHLEGRMVDTLQALGKDRPSHAVTARLEQAAPDRLRKAPEFADHFDPHVWFDVALWSECAQFVADQLAALDPPHADDYQANAARYIAELKKLDEECRQEIASIPESRRVLVTAHDAFGYFGRAYQMEVRGLQGVSTDDEADLGGIEDLVQMLVSRKIKAVFTESSVPVKTITSLVEGCHAQGHQVVVGGELYSDALGPAGSSAANYVGMVRHNLQTIVSALK